MKSVGMIKKASEKSDRHISIVVRHHQPEFNP